MSTEANVLERVSGKDELIFGLSDALDTKASIALIIITFLAAQTAWFVTERHVSGIWLAAQTLAALSLIGAGAMAIMALWPREYLTEPAEDLDTWIRGLEEDFKDMPDKAARIENTVTAFEIEKAKQRIAINGQKNETKSNYVERSFWCSSVAFGLNLVTVLALAIQRLS
jgi:hypothetical protein